MGILYPVELSILLFIDSWVISYALASFRYFKLIVSLLCRSISTRLAYKDILPKVIDKAILVTKSSSPNTHSIYSKTKELSSNLKSLVTNNPTAILSTSGYLSLVGDCLSSLGTTT